MATPDNWNKYINVVHELALIEYDLRNLVDEIDYNPSETILWERFGVRL